MSILRYSGHNLKDDRDKLTAEVMLEPSIGGAIKIDNNQNLLMVEIDKNLLTKTIKKKYNEKKKQKNELTKKFMMYR